MANLTIDELKARGQWDVINDLPYPTKPDRGSQMEVIVTRRRTFTRLERIQTPGGPGSLVEVPDWEDEETRETLGPGLTLKDAVKIYSDFPEVVAVREAQD